MQIRTKLHRPVSCRSARRCVGAFLSLFALSALACEGDTSGLGDGSVGTDSSLDAGRRDAAPMDATPVADAGPEDSGVLPDEWTVVPCPASAMPLPVPTIAGNGALEGILTVFVARVPRDAPLAGSRVVLEQGERTLEGQTDERGCVRFIGAGLAGPAQITVSATDHTMSIVRGLGSAQVDTGILSRASLSEPLMPPALDLATIAGEVTGFERMPSVTSTGTESRRAVAAVTPIYRRGTPMFGRPEPTRRLAPHEPLYANTAYLGLAYWGVSPVVDLRDFEVPVLAEYVVGLQVAGDLEVRPQGSLLSSSISSWVGVTLGVTAAGNTRVEGVNVDLAAPNSRRFMIPQPSLPDWAETSFAETRLYLPDADAYAFSSYASSNGEALLRPEFTGPLSSAEELVAFTFQGADPGAGGRPPNLTTFVRTRAAEAPAPALPSLPTAEVSGRSLRVRFSDPRDGAYLVFTLVSALGHLSIVDLGTDAEFSIDIPVAAEDLAIPDLDAILQASTYWLRTTSSFELRLSSDPLEARARFFEAKPVSLSPN